MPFKFGKLAGGFLALAALTAAGAPVKVRFRRKTTGKCRAGLSVQTARRMYPASQAASVSILRKKPSWCPLRKSFPSRISPE